VTPKKPFTVTGGATVPDPLAVRIRKTWGASIRELRTTRGMNQRQLAELLGVTQQAVGSWEAGKTAPRLEHQVAIAEALGVPWSVLFQVPSV
jgi:transcriptional regulator with XRE-family HTH domain